MSAKYANTSMIPKKGTQIQGLHLELPLRICRITGLLSEVPHFQKNV